MHSAISHGNSCGGSYHSRLAAFLRQARAGGLDGAVSDRTHLPNLWRSHARMDLRRRTSAAFHLIFYYVDTIEHPVLQIIKSQIVPKFNLFDLCISHSHCLIQCTLKLELNVLISMLHSLNLLVQHFKLPLDLGLQLSYFTNQFFNIHCGFWLLAKLLVSVIE